MKIAVLIPCYNEAVTIEKVVKDVKAQLPEAAVYVYDNNSKDDTAKKAAASGAIVVNEPRQGKGNMVRSMFKDIDADIYVLIDGDDTCPLTCVHDLLKPVLDNEADMVIGDRMSNGTYSKENSRAMHGFGNSLVKKLINFLFGSKLADIMSGYRVFNRYYVKTFPVLSRGSEIETEMTIYALHNNYKIKEVPIEYRDRPSGSVSKLNTYSNGFKVLKIVFSLFKDYKPLMFFGVCGLICAVIGIAVGILPILEFINTGYVYRVPSAILAAALEIIAILLFVCGLILDKTVKHQIALGEQLSTLFMVLDKKKDDR
ncbi:glycosyltransferase family 2 protein [Niastella populi]|uniref:Glycosyl transferase n=1 Tax=Niastella populi TaxID=550983 RepID=A0A1V9GB76_9BACT|nr:glycosyltransferase family 2 protein [Niastella populi]OQP67696.1 glycosyl transferase [Niastella populi]